MVQWGEVSTIISGLIFPIFSPIASQESMVFWIFFSSPPPISGNITGGLGIINAAAILIEASCLKPNGFSQKKNERQTRNKLHYLSALHLRLYHNGVRPPFIYSPIFLLMVESFSMTHSIFRSQPAFL